MLLSAPPAAAAAAAPHREVTALLQRKASWLPSDVARFTELYAQEHETETAVAAAKAGTTRLAEEVEGRQLALVDLIRERYQQVRQQGLHACMHACVRACMQCMPGARWCLHCSWCLDCSASG